MKKLLTLMLLTVMFKAGADNTSLFNPNPLKDDIIVSMPCEAQMVFRKIYTSNDPKKIKDKSFNAGSAQNKSPMSQNPNLQHVQGPFHDSKGYYLLVAKYELMKGQYEALVNADKCSMVKFNRLSRLPMVDISYFDAINASHIYSLFLQKDKGAYTNEKRIAYARLATDEEWEFSARGGNAVSQSQFESNLPPMTDDNLSLYAWYDGPSSANGKLQLSGLKKPNPLGLYDMFGNAQEMVLEPFKAVRTGRKMGLAGALCVRGGSYLTPADGILSARRVEKPLYLNGADVKSKDTGTRFVLSLPVASTPSEVSAMNADVLSLGDEDESHSDALAEAKKKISDYEKQNIQNAQKFKKQTTELKSRNESLEKLNTSLEKKSEQLVKLNSELVKLTDTLSSSNDSLNSQILDLKTRIDNANAQSESMREAAATANLRLGGFLCENISKSSATLEYYNNLLEKVKKQCDKSKDRCDNFKSVSKTVGEYSKSLKTLITYYGDTMADASSNYSMSIFKSQLENAKEAFGDESVYDDFVDIYFNHLKEYKNLSKDAKKNHKHWQEGCSVSVR